MLDGDSRENPDMIRKIIELRGASSILLTGPASEIIALSCFWISEIKRIINYRFSPAESCEYEEECAERVEVFAGD